MVKDAAESEISDNDARTKMDGVWKSAPALLVDEIIDVTMKEKTCVEVRKWNRSGEQFVGSSWKTGSLSET